MARFSTPEKAIRDINELKVGDTVCRVYGIWPPQSAGEATVSRAAIKFKDHPEYSDIHSSSKDQIVYDLTNVEYGFTSMEFASDSNLELGQSHNDNYIFRSVADAEEAVLWLREQWSASDGAIDKAIADRAMWLSMDDDFYIDYSDEDFEDRAA